MPLIQLPGIQLVAMAKIPLANLVEGTPYLAGKMEYRDSISLEGLSMTTSSVRNVEIKKHGQNSQGIKTIHRVFISVHIDALYQAAKCIQY